MTERASQERKCRYAAIDRSLWQSDVIAGLMYLCQHPCPLRRFAPALPKGEPFGYTSTTFYHTFPLATRLNGRKTAKTGRKVEKMRDNHSAAAPRAIKHWGKTPESPKIPLQLGCSVTQIRHFFKRTFFNLPLIFENNVKKATVWLHQGGKTYRFRKASPSGRGVTEGDGEGKDADGDLRARR